MRPRDTHLQLGDALSTDYGPADRLLHRLALDAGVAAASCVMEGALFGRRLNASAIAEREDHVFVAGLARAGTTMLMRLLHGTGAYCSLTYRDMPFVLAPNTWDRLSGLSRRDVVVRERAHHDGITEDADSPEALEEVFWRVHCGPSYIGQRALTPMRASADVIERFRRHVALVLRRYRSARYLSKNNNNILRLPSIRQAFPKALLLVPFRAPVQQAWSLLAQHRNFSARQRHDPFERRYMAWLAHHEFGLDHRPFAMAAGDAAVGSDGGPSELAYWLRQWVTVYDHVWRQAQDGAVDPVFVGYELLCRSSGSVRDWLASRLRVPRHTLVLKPRESRADVPAVKHGTLLDRAEYLHEAMLRSSLTTFSCEPDSPTHREDTKVEV